MTTLTQDRFDFSFYTEQSGSFLVPEKCNGEILVIASGGGGGGGGGGGARASASGGSAGLSGQNGGETSLEFSGGIISFSGGNGGAGGNIANSSSGGGGFAGLPLGASASNMSGRRNNAVSGTISDSEPDTPLRDSSRRNTFRNVSFIGGHNVKKNENILLFGANGGSSYIGRINTSNLTWAAFNNFVSGLISRVPISSAQGLNAGTSGLEGAMSGSIASGTDIYIGGGGGSGGHALKSYKKIKVDQNELININVGSGGNGGGGGGGGGNAFGGGGGGGGASGFVWLFWNED